MADARLLIKPQSLIPGGYYFRNLNAQPPHADSLSLVSLVAYASCPAVVIVEDASGKVERCSRDEIFAVRGSPEELGTSTGSEPDLRSTMVSLGSQIKGGNHCAGALSIGHGRSQSMKKTYTKSGRSCRVTFELPAEAETTAVSVCGEFNDWDPSVHPMKKRKDGRFSTTISLRPGRRYRFRYLLDGKRWENDWDADDYVPNDYGEEDSVVEV